MLVLYERYCRRSESRLALIINEVVFEVDRIRPFVKFTQVFCCEKMEEHLVIPFNMPHFTKQARLSGKYASLRGLES